MVVPRGDLGGGEGFAGCLRAAMLYLASSHLLTEETFPKIICSRPERVAIDLHL